MLVSRLSAAVAVAALVGLAACAAEEETPDAVLTDTVTQPGVEMVPVPVTDTAVVQTEISIDTMVEVDTAVVEGQATTPQTTPPPPQ